VAQGELTTDKESEMGVRKYKSCAGGCGARQRCDDPLPVCQNCWWALPNDLRAQFDDDKRDWRFDDERETIRQMVAWLVEWRELRP
jgi:hypothetical protein